jgi:Mn-dependent DtxR family transcriptional regulator
LKIQNPTVKRILAELRVKGMLEKQGNARETIYIFKNQ